MTASHPFGRTQGELLRLIGGLFLSLAPLLFGASWGIRETHTVRGPGIAPSEGFKYSVLVPASAFEPFFHLDGDGVRYPRRADTRVYEDGRQLGPPHRPHDFIRADGRGQFSHWGSTLYFSSSDYTDPRANGRIYRFITGATASSEFLGWWAICAPAVTGLAYWLRRTRRAASDASRACPFPG